MNPNEALIEYFERAGINFDDLEAIRDFLTTLEDAINHDWIRNRPDPYVAFADPDRDYVGGFSCDDGRAFITAVRHLIGDHQ